MDIRFSNLAGAHTNNQYDDPNKTPQRAITIWFDDDEIADALKRNDFLVGRAEDSYHKDEKGDPLGERYFIKFVAYLEKVWNADHTEVIGRRLRRTLNPRTGKEEVSPKIVIKSFGKAVVQEIDGFANVDHSYINRIDISFRRYKYDQRRPSIAAINEFWCELDDTAGGRNDFYDDYLEQKWADLPDSDEVEVPFS
jgi:hypothetical protein